MGLRGKHVQGGTEGVRAWSAQGSKVGMRGVRGAAGWAHVGCEAHTRRPAMAGSSPTAGAFPSGLFQPQPLAKALSSRFNPRCRKKKKTQQLATVCKAQPFPSGIISVSAPRTAGPPQKTARRNVITAKGRPGAAGSLRGTAPGRER